CLRYFGGAVNILAATVAGAAEQGFGVHAAIAPTPRGALWLARAGAAAICIDTAMLAAALDSLPLEASGLPAGARERLAGFGAATLGAARRLPRAGLARRIGAESVTALAQAYGELPDPRPDFAFPERFTRGIELPAPAENAAALLFAARRLTAALVGWLAARQAGIAACLLRLGHRDAIPTDIVLRFAAPTREAGRLERVLQERLERLTLAAPAESLQLSADAIVPLPGRSAVLFGGGERGEGMAVLVERLRARLGDADVHGIAAAPDHRPEGATRIVPVGAAGRAVPAGPRPFWLLAVPEVLPERNGRPWRNGPLRLLAGPERIESGWWGGGGNLGDARRDYFVALTADTRWAWIFRELRPPGGWFLHGWFA
ncbi:partial Protein ImuB, partial [Rhodocyclaceae bacterium]